MVVRVVYLGPARDWAGVAEEAIELHPGATLGDLQRNLAERHRGWSQRSNVLRYAVNNVFAPDTPALSDGDEVAVIPPVSGGSEDTIRLIAEPIDSADIRRRGSNGGRAGGVVLFEGVTRLEVHPKHGPLIRLEYEAYVEMAVKQLRELVSRARSRWRIESLAVVHRIGPVAVGESSVLIAVTCGHRAEAFEACRWLIDALKRDVPIWKREVWADGATTWSDPADAPSGVGS